MVLPGQGIPVLGGIERVNDRHPFESRLPLALVGNGHQVNSTRSEHTPDLAKGLISETYMFHDVAGDNDVKLAVPERELLKILVGGFRIDGFPPRPPRIID